MAHGDWEGVYQAYAKTYQHTRYADHARAMMALIPQLQSHPAFDGVVPGTSHATLYLQVPGSAVRVNVWSPSADTYEVYLDDPEGGNLESQTVNRGDLVAVLQAYLNRIRLRPS